MEIIVGETRTEIDVDRIASVIDSVLHDEITDKTGVTVNNKDIYAFISRTIREHNKRELLIRYEEDELNKERESIYRKIKSGKSVDGTGTLVKKFKYYFLGYIDVGKGDSDD